MAKHQTASEQSWKLTGVQLYLRASRHLHILKKEIENGRFLIAWPDENTRESLGEFESTKGPVII